MKKTIDVNVWDVFKMNTMGNYHDLHLKIDIFLLADAFEKFINTCLEYYGLDPCRYFSRPGLSWDAMLKMTWIELELIPDIDMHLFIQKGVKGGISYIAKDSVKQIINTCNHMMLIIQVHLLHIWMQIVFMLGQ